MRTLKIIETIEELIELFKSGKLEGCTVRRLSYSWIFSQIIVKYKLTGTDEYELSEKLAEGDTILRQVFSMVGISLRLN